MSEEKKLSIVYHPMDVRLCTMREIRVVEQEHIEVFGCELNPISSYVSDEERRERDVRSKKAYHEVNKDRDNERSRSYREVNRERLNELSMEWYWGNRERVSARRRERVTCDCGDVVTRGAMSAHRRSQRHLDWVIDVD